MPDRFRTLLFVFFGLISQMCLSQTTITHAIADNPREALAVEILKLAIEKSGSGARYRFEELNEGVTEARMVDMLKDGTLSVVWAGTQRKYEEQLYPIRIPMLKGLLGHRIFIIRQGDQSRFDNVSTLDDLRSIPLGQGRFWGDTVVLKNAGMNVIDPVKYESLFYMLEGGRFDFFPRAVHEPWSEVASRRELNLTVEDSILLIYPFAMYYFVSQDNAKLGRVIETGFRNAIDDGSYDELFFNHPMIRNALEQSDLKKRRIFRLSNPNMSPETPINDTSLWLNIEDL